MVLCAETSFGSYIGKLTQLDISFVSFFLVTCSLLTGVLTQGLTEIVPDQEQQQDVPQPFAAYESPSYSYNNPRFANSFVVSRVPSDNQRYSSLYEADSHIRRQAIRLLLPITRTLPWGCGCDMFWRDLGENYHPRFIRDGRCRTTTCYHGHYACVPTKYQVPVLKRIMPEDEIDENDRIFDSEFYFVSVLVTSSCECGRGTPALR